MVNSIFDGTLPRSTFNFLLNLYQVESQVSIEFALDVSGQFCLLVCGFDVDILILTKQEHGQFMKTAVTEIKTEISNVATKIDKGNAVRLS